jgi:4-hydroxy-2-oxovalerate aldolase
LKTLNNDFFILDTTLRDGSYIIDFSFTPSDTYIISSILDQALIDFIEIGHGLGIGKNKKIDLVYKEEEYFEAVDRAVSNSKWGTFFIPGIGTKDDIDILSKFNCYFLRIGIEVNDIKKAIPYLEYAKEKGFFVCLNLMKTYMVSPKELENILKSIKQDLYDVVYIVDSSGGMVFSDLLEYINAIKNTTTNKIGFHGHNNLDMANANTLFALQNGVSIVDSSIRGMGRSAGNCITESLVLLLNKMEISNRYDYKLLMDLGQNFIKPICHSLARDQVSYISGYSDFHSSYLGLVNKYSTLYGVDQVNLITELKARGLTNSDEKTISQVAIDINSKKMDNISFISQTKNIESLEELSKELLIKSRKYGKVVFMNFIESDINHVSNVINEYKNVIYGNAKFKDFNFLKESIDKSLNQVDFLYIHAKDEMLNEIKKLDLKSKKIILYDNEFVWAYTILDQILKLVTTKDIKINIYGKHIIANKFLSLVQNSNLVSYSENQANVLVLFDEIPKDYNLEQYEVIIDGKIGLIDKSKEQYKDIDIFRFDMTYNLAHLAYMDYQKNKRFLESKKDTLVSNGFIGEFGDIAVDNVNNPRKIYGICDGKGYLKKHDTNDEDTYKKIFGILSGNSKILSH